MSTSRHTIPHPRPDAGLLLLVAALVVGVLGMHALSTACMHSGEATVAIASPPMSHAGDNTGTDTGTGGQYDSAAGAHHDDAGSSNDGAMALCLAVLLAIGSLWLAMALRRSVRGWRITRPRTPQTPSLAVTSWPRPPPSLTRLSILRC